MKHQYIKALSKPFVWLGAAWQFISGSFYAGRIVSAMWIEDAANARYAQLAKEGKVTPRATHKTPPPAGPLDLN